MIIGILNTPKERQCSLRNITAHMKFNKIFISYILLFVLVCFSFPFRNKTTFERSIKFLFLSFFCSVGFCVDFFFKWKSISIRLLDKCVGLLNLLGIGFKKNRGSVQVVVTKLGFIEFGPVYLIFYLEFNNPNATLRFY